ncbi:MAG TPA: MerR family transcriptional regulator [Euzebya sp.]|nr:MerR family transcriptional regulator [Euzebya sp.]
MSDGLLPIGMFSRAAMVSIKQLRAYHDMGLLVPAAIDPVTGYRRYGVDQLADAAVIVRLRALDLPLQQVREVLTSRDPAHTRAVLDAHRTTMQGRLDQTERIVAELQSGLAPATHTPVHVTVQKPASTLRLAGDVAEAAFGPWLDHAYGLLAQALEASGAIPAGPAGACYPPEIADDDLQAVQAHLPVADPVPLLPAHVLATGVAVGELPAAECAVLVHTGPYDTIGETYRTLGAWVARHARHAAQPVRERYLIGPDATEDPASYRTEICWPIIPGSGPTRPQDPQEHP